MMAEDPIQSLEVVAHWMADNMHLLRTQAENARKLGKPLAAYDAAEMVWEAAQSDPADQISKRIARRRSLINLLKHNHIPWEENIAHLQR